MKKKKDINEEVNEDIIEEVNEEIAEEENKDENIDQEENDENLTKQYEELNNRYLRLQADFVNFKKRNEKEKESLVTYAKSTIATDVLNVLDNFERAFVSVEEDIRKSGFYQGMEMVHKQLIDILTKNGMEEIEAINKKFDPNHHFAVMQEESEEFDQDTVIEVLQKGYKLNEKVIRPSMVKVSK